MKRGEADRSVDRDLLLDLIYGPLIYGLMVKQASIERERAEAMVSALFRGIGSSSFKTNRYLWSCPRSRAKRAAGKAEEAG